MTWKLRALDNIAEDRVLFPEPIPSDSQPLVSPGSGDLVPFLELCENSHAH